MSEITIPCPLCRSLLKLPDAALLGKKGRCPKCQHRFVLRAPDVEDVPLELADPPTIPLPERPPVPQVGTSARWVPDDEIPVFPQFPANLPGDAADGTTGFSGFTDHPERLREVPGAAESTGKSSFELPDFSTVTGPVTDAATLPGARAAKAPLSVRRRKRRSAGGWWLLTVCSVIVAGVIVIGVVLSRNQSATNETAQAGPAPNPAYEAEQARRVAANATAESLSPTSGKPIPLDYLPFTPHVICHLRPSELWKKDRATGEFQALLSALGIWLQDQIVTRTRFEPQEIAEATFAVNFGAKMTAPDVAVVVRLREQQTPTDLMKRFRGRLRPDPTAEVYEADDFSFLLIDRQTFVSAPLTLSADLIAAVKFPALASPDMEPLLNASDRDRHATLLFDLRLLDSHREEALPAAVLPLFNQFMLWMGDGIETASWSLHLEPHLYLETLLHPTTDSNSVQEQREFRASLSRLPETMLQVVRKMKPATTGSRRMIGRFPAMLAALEAGSTTHTTTDIVRSVTLLPKHAAANLAAASLLTWNQSLLTRFDDAELTSADQTKIPDKVRDRLQLKVLVDFRRMPLQEAVAYLGDSIKTEVSIDGDALKGAGFTQNMEQTMNLGNVTALAAIDAILQKYAGERDPLVLIVDESAKRLLFSTKSKAEADGLAVFDTSP